MSALKEVKTDHLAEDQLELPIGREEITKTQVIALPKIPLELASSIPNVPVQATEVSIESINVVRELEDKKNSTLQEIERLDQYLQQKNKKLQEAKTFIEQYERVVVNKKSYIEQVESERTQLVKEIENLKASKERVSFEVDDYQTQIQNLKKQINDEKNNLNLFEKKISEKQAQSDYHTQQIDELVEKKRFCQQEHKNIEEEFHNAKEKFYVVKNELSNLESQIGQYNRNLYEKRSELENLRELLNHFVEAHKQVESELTASVERLKSDESTWRFLVEERTKVLESTERQIEVMHEEIKNKQIDLEQTQQALSIAKNKLLQVGDLVQNEQVEAERWEDKVSKLQSRLDELSQHYHQLELSVITETADVEMMRNRRVLEEQEQYKLQIAKEHLLHCIHELEVKKKNCELEYQEKHRELMNQLSHEHSLKDQEGKTLRLMREEEFQSDLKNEKMQMKEIFWSEVSQRLDSLADEVSNYMATCMNVNFDKMQKEKLNNHIVSLTKYYHGLDAKSSKMRDVSYTLRRFQPYAVFTIGILSVACLIALILK